MDHLLPTMTDPDSLPVREATRLLAIPGGGPRGVIAAAFLERLESLGRARHGRDYRLRQSFHLVGGTGTGAVLATAVALGLPADWAVAFQLKDGRADLRRTPSGPSGPVAESGGAALHRAFARMAGGRPLSRRHLGTELALLAAEAATAEPVLLTTARGATAPRRCLGASVRAAPAALDDLLRAAGAMPGAVPPAPAPIGPGGSAPPCSDAARFEDPSLLLHAYVRGGGLGAARAAGALEIVTLGSGRPGPAAAHPTLAGPVAGIAERSGSAATALRGIAADPSARLRWHRHDIALDRDTLELLGVSLSGARLRQLADPCDARDRQRLYEIAALYAERAIEAPLPLRGGVPREAFDAVA